MPGIREITEETLSMIQPEIKKAYSQGYTLGLGLTGFELDAPSKKLFPVLSPFRNRVPRKKAPVGSQAAHWRAITKIGADRSDPSVPFGQAGPRAGTETMDFSAQYRVIARDDFVIMDAQMLAQGFEDLRATAGINLLYLMMIDEDKVALGGQSFNLPAPAQPVLVAGGNGQLAAGTLHVKVRARTLRNWFYGGGSVLSPEATIAVGDGGSVDARVSAVVGAVAYDWYVSGDGNAWFYYTTTVVNAVHIDHLPAADELPPLLPDLVPAKSHADAVAEGDTSGNPNSIDGLLATVAGSWLNGTYVTPGTPGSVPSGGIWRSLDGKPFTFKSGTAVEINEVLLELWDRVRLSPTRILMSGRESSNIAMGIVQSSGGGATYTVVQSAGAEREGIEAGYAVAAILNPVTHRPIPVETQPHLPPGTMAIITEQLPYPNNQVANVFEIETQQEYQQIEYAMARLEGPNGGPRYDFEVRAIECFKNYFPAAQAIITNIGE